MAEFEPIPLADFEEVSLDEARRRLEAFRALMARRRTIRDFSDRPVPRDLVEQAIRIAGSAPSGANLQPWRFVAIADAAVKRRIREGAEAEEQAFYAGKAGAAWLEALKPLGTDADKSFLEAAPWLIAIFGARRALDADGVERKAYYVPESVSIATGFLIAALHGAGLATLTHTPSPMGFLNDICGRPETEKPMILLVVGYPADGAVVPAVAARKKPLDEIADFIE